MGYFNRGDIAFAAGILSVVCLAGAAEDALDRATAAYMENTAPPAQTAAAELEDQSEPDLIQEALVLSGYLREDVPLNYDLQAVLYAECERYGIDQAVALGLIEVESDFRPETVSGCGAYGLMQLNPRYFPGGLSDADNIKAGMEYLAACIARYDSLEAGLTAYNAGHDTGSRAYARRVLEAAEGWQ